MSYVPPPVSTPPGSVPNYLAWSIIATVLSTFLCCTCISIPGIATGIAAIVFSIQVNKKLNAGDFDGAARASKTTKILCWVTTAFVAIGLAYFCYSLATVGVDGFQAQFEEAMKQAQQSR
jgi:hypothetical protein